MPVAERAASLFARNAGDPIPRRRGKPKQRDMFAAIGEAGEAAGIGVASVFRPGETALDRLHQSMLPFTAGRGEALKRFLVEDGVRRDQRLSRWHRRSPPSIRRKPRTSDGVLARKKGLGL